MTLSTAFARLRAVARAALFTAAAIGLAGAAQAQQQRNADVFVGVYKDEQKPIIVFTLSDPGKPELQEVTSYALFAVPGYTPEDKKFVPKEGCRVAPGFSTKGISSKYKISYGAKPIYGPNSSQDIIDPFSLPSYMAREAVKKLLSGKYVADTETARPYFNCTGWFWARLLDQPPSFWNEFLKQKIEETQKETKN